MKAIAQKKFGDANVLEEITLDIPSLGPHDLLVKTKAVALNPVDIKKRSNYGNNNATLEKPLILGYDGSGIVEKVGEKVSLFKVGDEVYFAGVLTRSGTFGEYTAVDERIVGKKPKSLNWVQSAVVPLCVLTSWEGIFEQLLVSRDPKENKDKSILIIAGAGGVGSFAIQVAKYAGLTVIATSSRKESTEYCKKLGADFVINHKEDLLEQIKAIKELNGGVNYVYNTASTDQYFDKLPGVLLPLGRAVFINGTQEKFAIGPWMSKRLTFTFELMFTRPLYDFEPEKQNELLNKVSELIDQGVIHHTLTESHQFTLENVKKGMLQIESGTTIGKIGFEK